MNEVKRFLAIVSVLFLSSQLYAFKVPVDKDGEIAQSIRDIGVRVYTTTTTVPFLITGGTVSIPNGAATGSSIAVLGVLTSSAPGTLTSPSFLEMRATNTANSTTELLNVPLMLQSTSYNSLYIFNPPLVAAENLSVNMTSSGITSIFYSFLSTNGIDSDLTFIPIDEYQGLKVHDSSLYGVKVGTPPTYAGLAANDRSGSEVMDFTVDEKLMVESTSTPNLAHVYGWCASSGAAGSFLIFRDTNTTGSLVNTNLFLPPIFPRMGPLSGFGGNIEFSQSTCYSFPWPLNTRTGLSIQANVATERFRIFRRNKRTLR